MNYEHQDERECGLLYVNSVDDLIIGVDDRTRPGFDGLLGALITRASSRMWA